MVFLLPLALNIGNGLCRLLRISLGRYICLRCNEDAQHLRRIWLFRTSAMAYVRRSVRRGIFVFHCGFLDRMVFNDQAIIGCFDVYPPTRCQHVFIDAWAGRIFYC